MAEFVQFSNLHCKPVDSQFEALVEAQVKGQVQEILEAWEEKLAFSIDNRLAAIAGSWAIYGLAQDWSHSNKRLAIETFVENITPIINVTLGIEEAAGVSQAEDIPY